MKGQGLIALVLAAASGCTFRSSNGTGDGGVPDGGPIADGRRADAALIDGGVVDGGIVDGRPADAALADAATPDASSPDASPPDASPPDASPPDASPPDASPPDAAPIDAAPPPDRITDGLVGLWTFAEGAGGVIHDTSGVAPALDLVAADANVLAWGAGTVTLLDKTRITLPVDGARNRASVAARTAGQATVEAWVVPAKESQIGAPNPTFPARIFTISRSTGARNVSLGQFGDAWAGQIRTLNAEVTTQGNPMLLSSAGSVTRTLTHLAVTADGTARAFYVDGQLVASDARGGAFTKWDQYFRITLGAETIGATPVNPWVGAYDLVAMYARALGASEIATNYAAGPE